MVQHMAAHCVCVALLLFSLSSPVEARYLKVRRDASESGIPALIGPDEDGHWRLQRSLLESKGRRADSDKRGKEDATRKADGKKNRGKEDATSRADGKKGKWKLQVEDILARAEQVAQKRLRAAMEEARAKGEDAELVKWSTKPAAKQLQERKDGKATADERNRQERERGKEKEGARSRSRDKEDEEGVPEQRSDEEGVPEKRSRRKETPDSHSDETGAMQEAASRVSKEDKESKARRDGKQKAVKVTEDTLKEIAKDQTVTERESEKGDGDEKVNEKKSSRKRRAQNDLGESQEEAGKEVVEEKESETSRVGREEKDALKKTKEESQVPDDSQEESQEGEENSGKKERETGRVERQEDDAMEPVHEDVQEDVQDGETQRTDTGARQADLDVDGESAKEKPLTGEAGDEVAEGEQAKAGHGTGKRGRKTEERQKNDDGETAMDEEAEEDTDNSKDMEDDAEEKQTVEVDDAERQSEQSALLKNQGADEGVSEKGDDEVAPSMLGKKEKKVAKPEKASKDEGSTSGQEDSPTDSLEQAGDAEDNSSIKKGSQQEEEQENEEAGDAEVNRSTKMGSVQEEDQEKEEASDAEENAPPKGDLTKSEKAGEKNQKAEEKDNIQEKEENEEDEKLETGVEPQLFEVRSGDAATNSESALEKAQEELAEELSEADDYDLSAFLTGITNAGENLGRTLHGMQEKTKQIFVPKAGDALKHTKSIVDTTEKIIHKNLETIVGPNVSPWLSTTTSYVLLLLPIAVVALALDRIRASLSLQKVVLAVNMYLAVYTFVLFAACFLLGAEPMSILRSSSYESYIVLHLVQLGGYLIYLALQVANAVLLWRSSGSAPLSIVIGLTQCIAALAVGLHYYITVFQHVMVDKHAIVTARLYAVYFVIFGSMCLSARLKRTKQESVGGGGNKTL